MESWMVRLYRFLVKKWNAFLAGTSLIGVGVFSVIPPLQKYVPLFVFAAANAVVWTVIEIKSELGSARPRVHVIPNMRIARSDILGDVRRSLGRSTKAQPVQLVFVGGRLRSMSEIVRELADDMRSGKCFGHASISLYAVHPGYIAERVLPGRPADEQRHRNALHGAIVENIRTEMERLNSWDYGSSSFTISVRYYSEDPHIYAYVMGSSVLYWGTFTWSDAESDFVGPENPCYRLTDANPEMFSIRSWILNRAQLWGQESDRSNQERS